jgi:hypothetical protein
MKFVLLFCGDAEDTAAYDALSGDEVHRRLAEVGAWIGENRGRVEGGSRLMPPESATTVRFGAEGPPVVTDGPFLEGKEWIGGYVQVDVADLDEALRMAKTWPGRGKVEIRPVMSQPDL